MKENKYDDKEIFEKYSQMERSTKGLSGAGEWESLRKILPDFKGKKILDLGCGFGWHANYAIEKGAAKVIGIDISEKMLKIAREKTKSEKIEYINMAIEDFDFDDESFDIVFSSLAFHYVEDYNILVDKIRKVLKVNGNLIFTVEHPVFTSYGSQDWHYDKDGNILHFPIDNYYYEGERMTSFLGEDVIKYHRTLTTYLNTLLTNGFSINQIIEPEPPEHMMDILGMKDEMRRPMMLIVSVTKLDFKIKESKYVYNKTGKRS